MYTAIPSLSTTGWITDTKEGLDSLLFDFLASAKSGYPQGTIEASLPWLIVKHQDKYDDLATDCQKVLDLYLKANFPTVQVVVTQAPSLENKSWIDLRITGRVTDADGKVTDLAHVATVGGQRVVRFAKENNGTLAYLG